jgi:DNA-binding NtrC family response regulator
MRLGAENFLTKPVELAHLEAATDRAFEKAELRRRNRFFAERQADGSGLPTLGRSPAMREIARQIELLTESDTTVLLLGETGTGKGWVAHLLHSSSRRAAAPFVEINCAGLSATFVASEMFGHEKGAFTDAKEMRRGLFEIADTGTFFLDEVGDLAAELQPKLLKVLETRKFRRLGGTREIEADVRLIAATNRDLEAAVRAGTAEFRRDLGRGPTRISAEALNLMTQYSWPGNIRELRNVLERILLFAGSAEEVQVGHLPADLVKATVPAATSDDADLSLEEIERRHIARVLERHAGNRARTARTLGISRATLYEKLSRYGLDHVGRASNARR